MGIPKFFMHLKRKAFKGVFNRYPPRNVSSLSVDMNSVLHQVAQLVYNYGEHADPARTKLIARADPAQLESEYFHALGINLTTLITTINPRDILVLAVDGVAPQAKIAQQRQRRYRSAFESAMKGESTMVFNPSSISPGTEFMHKIDNFLQRWLVANSKTLPKKVIYSSHMMGSPDFPSGEGEAIILSLMRRGDIPQGEGAHVIVGQDADLLMLGMIAPLEHISIYRDEYTSVDIDNLKAAYQEELGTPTAVDDFVVMMFLIGNDFLPHMVSLGDIDESIETLLRVYVMTGVALTQDGDIHWEGFRKYLAKLAREEPRLLELESQREVKHPSKHFEQATKRVMELSNRQGGKATEDHVLDEKIKRTSIFDMDAFRGSWYSNALLPKKVGIFSMLMPETNFKKVSGTALTNMIKDYLIGVAWVYRYYKVGMENINNDYVYSNHYAPLIADVAKIAEKYDVPLEKYHFNEFAISINPVHQLLAIIPYQSRELLPKEVLMLTTSLGSLAEYFIRNAIIDRQGFNNDWQGVVLINFVDMKRVVDAVDNECHFDDKRLIQFSPVNLIVLEKQQEVVDLHDKTRRYKDFLERQTGGRGRGRGRGRGNQQVEGRDNQGGNRNQQREEGRDNRDRGYQSGGRDRGYQSGGRGRGQDSGGRGRGQDSGGRGRGYQSGGRGRGQDSGGRGRGYQSREGGGRGRGYNKTAKSPYATKPQTVAAPVRTSQHVPAGQNVEMFEL